jgi:hypothetical protein
MPSSLDTPNGWYPGATRIAIPTSNFSFGRSGRSIRAVVLHVEAGYSAGTIAKFKTPGVQSSTHFEITKRGKVNQFVSILDTAYGNGLHYAAAPEAWLRWAGPGWYNPRGVIVHPTWPLLQRPFNPNLDTISIEHEGQSADVWTIEMDAANTALLKWIAGQTKLAYVPLQTLIGHCHLDTVDRPFCPGPHVDYTRIAMAATALPIRHYVATFDTPIFESRIPNTVALAGAALIHVGDAIEADDLTNGFLHLRDQRGFVPVGCFREVV